MTEAEGVRAQRSTKYCIGSLVVGLFVSLFGAFASAGTVTNLNDSGPGLLDRSLGSNAPEDPAIGALVDRFAALIVKVSGKEPVL